MGDNSVNESANDWHKFGAGKKIEMAWEFAGFSVCGYLITWNDSPNIFT